MIRALRTLMALGVLLGACGGGRDGPAERTLTVFAAASLVEAFGELTAELEKQDTTLDVRLNIAGSQQLAGQLVRGAVADVFAAADRNMFELKFRHGLLHQGAAMADHLAAEVVARGNGALAGGRVRDQSKE